ncbi:MAG: histidine kinase, partial [Myxococcales bacterium]|nr:histidine kinase [Myxococcales bacterium]
MIAACPECRTQFRVDPQRLSGEGVRLRCTRCETIFR